MENIFLFLFDINTKFYSITLSKTYTHAQSQFYNLNWDGQEFYERSNNFQKRVKRRDTVPI